MSEMLNILFLLCGLDYSNIENKQCIKNTTICFEKSIKKLKKRKESTPFTKGERDLFYKCYNAGAVKTSKGS